MPLIDSINMWESLLIPNNTVSPRKELFLSHYPDSGDLTGSNNSALILGTHKIICGYQANQGFWQSPMYVCRVIRVTRAIRVMYTSQANSGSVLCIYILH